MIESTLVPSLQSKEILLIRCELSFDLVKALKAKYPEVVPLTQYIIYWQIYADKIKLSFIKCAGYKWFVNNFGNNIKPVPEYIVTHIDKCYHSLLEKERPSWLIFIKFVNRLGFACDLPSDILGVIKGVGITKCGF